MESNIDWNDMWMKAMEKASWRKNTDCETNESNNLRLRLIAEQFNSDSIIREHEWNQSSWVLSKVYCPSDITVMDIGAGPGTMAIPIARKVKHLTAVDPSAEMIHFLQERAYQEGLKNLSYINKKWEDIESTRDVEEHDVLIASFSLYMMDLKAALCKMNELANDYVFLFTFVGNPEWDQRTLWKKLYDEDFCIGPDYIYVNNILYDMGIYANLEISDVVHVQRFSSLEKAVLYYSIKLRVHSPTNREIIHEYLSNNFIAENGYFFSKHPMKIARIWWRK